MKVHRPILFLDFDGVMCCDRYLERLLKEGHPTTDDEGTLFVPEAVSNLRRIVETTGCQIVVSSTWRIDGESRIRRIWKNRNMPGELIGVTPILLFSTYQDADTKERIEKPEWEAKAFEVNAWLEKNEITYARYAILDDENMFLFRQQDHLVVTDAYDGLTRDKAEEVISILTSKKE